MPDAPTCGNMGVILIVVEAFLDLAFIKLLNYLFPLLCLCERNLIDLKLAFLAQGFVLLSSLQHFYLNLLYQIMVQLSLDIQFLFLSFNFTCDISNRLFCGLANRDGIL